MGSSFFIGLFIYFLNYLCTYLFVVAGVDAATSVDVHPSGGQLIVGGENMKLYFYDIELSSRVFKILRAHTRAITTAVFHPTMPLMATSSYDGCVSCRLLYAFSVAHRFNEYATLYLHIVWLEVDISVLKFNGDCSIGK